MMELLRNLRNWRRQWVYKPGRVLSRFVERDVRRDIRIVSSDRLHEGIVIGQVRTNNVLYLAKHLVADQDFGEPIALEIATMWKWSGQPWGGLPDGTSIADHVEGKPDLLNTASQPIAAKRGSG